MSLFSHPCLRHEQKIEPTSSFPQSEQMLLNHLAHNGWGIMIHFRLDTHLLHNSYDIVLHHINHKI